MTTILFGKIVEHPNQSQPTRVTVNHPRAVIGRMSIRQFPSCLKSLQQRPFLRAAQVHLPAALRRDWPPRLAGTKFNRKIVRLKLQPKKMA